MPLARVHRHTCSQGQADGMKMRALKSKSTLEMRAIYKTGPNQRVPWMAPEKPGCVSSLMVQLGLA